MPSMMYIKLFDTIAILNMNEQQLQEVYQMVDSINLTRPKRNISRDFSDAVLMAEVIEHYNPKLIQTHNYPSSNSL